MDFIGYVLQYSEHSSAFLSIHSVFRLDTLSGSGNPGDVIGGNTEQASRLDETRLLNKRGIRRKPTGRRDLTRRHGSCNEGLDESTSG